MRTERSRKSLRVRRKRNLRCAAGGSSSARLLPRECRATRPLTRRLVTLLVEPLRVLVPAHVSLRARVLVAAGPPLYSLWPL